MNVYTILSCYRPLNKWLKKYIKNLPLTEDMYPYFSALVYYSQVNDSIIELKILQYCKQQSQNNVSFLFAFLAAFWHLIFLKIPEDTFYIHIQHFQFKKKNAVNFLLQTRLLAVCKDSSWESSWCISEPTALDFRYNLLFWDAVLRYR